MMMTQSCVQACVSHTYLRGEGDVNVSRVLLDLFQILHKPTSYVYGHINSTCRNDGMSYR